MTLLELLTTILGQPPIFGGDNEPFKILEKINETAETQFIDYNDYYLYKDQQTAKIWFNTLINRYYNYLCFNIDHSEYSANVTIVNFIIKLFSKYEELYPKYKLLFDLYNDEQFKNKIIKDNIEITQNNQSEDYLMPQDKTEEDTINNKRKSNSTNITNYNNNYFNKINNITKNLTTLLSIWIDEFDDFFYKDWGYY